MLIRSGQTYGAKGRITLPIEWVRENPGPYVLTLLPQSVFAILPSARFRELLVSATPEQKAYLSRSSVPVDTQRFDQASDFVRILVPSVIREATEWRPGQRVVWLEWRGGLRVVTRERWEAELRALEPVTERPDFPIPSGVREAAAQIRQARETINA